nr:family 20 glycosylhydrolase [Armatimonas rosea]
MIPKPVSVTQVSGAFVLDEKVTIGTDVASRPAAQLLSGWLKATTGRETKVGGRGSISLKVNPALTNLGSEGYQLEVSSKGVGLSAPKYAGIVNGLQTFRQLWPTGKAPQFTLPAVRIEDQPTFAWRGMMLDVSRYFMDKAYVLHFLDIMAAHKLNVLHLHLIDDAGWRVEIKKYPKLTQIGGFRGEGAAREGGFYTQADIKEMVAYATARNITIVPEIELPAHTLSAVCAYPWLACTGKQHTMPTVHFISDDLYCAGKSTTWAFLKDVFDELCALFPSQYIHIGGDEAQYSKWRACPDCQKKKAELGLADEKALQGWMTREVEGMLAKKGKRILGWNEILRCGVSTTAGIMAWNDAKAAGDAARGGNPVVVALTTRCYFDMQQSKLRGELPGAGWSNPVTLQNAYDWDPMPTNLDAAQQKNILGVQGCLWTDMFLHKPEIKKPSPAAYCDYYLLPRAAALAEVAWTPQAQRRFPDFTERMKRQYVRYTDSGWNFRLPLPELTHSGDTVTATCPIEGGTVRYTTDGTDPTASSPELKGTVTVARFEDLKAITLAPDGKRTSLIFETLTPTNPFKQYGTKLGEWKSGKVGDRKAIPVDFDVSKLISGNGTYQITFVYTSGRERLDIDKVEVFRNTETLALATDRHHGFTGGATKDNVYTLKLEGFDPSASYTLRAHIYGDEGSDSNGVVLIKKVN